MKPALSYFGGKIRIAPWIVEAIKRYEHMRYIEVFGGSGAVLFAKPPSKCEIYNDLYSDLVTFYKVLRDRQQYQELIRLLEGSPYSRQIYHDSRRTLEEKEISDVERARCFFISLRQSFSNLMNSWSSPSECSRTVASITYWRAIDRLPEIHERLKNVHIENLDAIQCIEKYANENSLMYLDPPYVHATRKSTNDYVHEYSNEQHEQLVATLLEVPGHKILSGYESPLYQPLIDAGWDLLKREVCCHASGAKRKTYRTECLYCSPVKVLDYVKSEFNPISSTTNLAVNNNTGTIRINNIGAKKMKHPFDRKVFFTRQRNDFLSLNEIQTLTRTGKLALSDFVFDVDGDSYTAGNIALGKAPRWAMTAEHDPMLHDLPPLSEEDIALANELACEDGFLEMPEEPKSKTVSHYLATEPRIARFVADAEHCLF